MKGGESRGGLLSKHGWAAERIFLHETRSKKDKENNMINRLKIIAFIGVIIATAIFANWTDATAVLAALEYLSG